MKRKMLTAYYDNETGELVDIVFSEGFKAESPLMHADVLQDIATNIEAAYVDAVGKAFPGANPPDAADKGGVH